MSYDSALTVFSPEGTLHQVDYASRAVEKGSSVVGVRAKDCVVIGVEKTTTGKLQQSSTIKKIEALDEHVIVAFAGLVADARVLFSRARVQCQSFRLTVEDKVTVEYITRWIAQLQQRYTQRGGARPFGVSFLVAGVDEGGIVRLYKTGTWWWVLVVLVFVWMVHLSLLWIYIHLNVFRCIILDMHIFIYLIHSCFHFAINFTTQSNL